MHDTGCLGLVHWDDPEGWYGEVGGFGGVGTESVRKDYKASFVMMQAGFY